MEEPQDTAPEREIYQLFRLSITVKGLISLGEVIVGTLLLLVPSRVVIAIAQMFAQYAHSAGSYGSIAGHVATELDRLTGATVVFLAFYLLVRGIIKVGLVIALLMNKVWAYPASLVVLGLFVLYQLYEIVTLHSILVILLTTFDLIVMYLIWREYQIIRAHRAARL